MKKVKILSLSLVLTSIAATVIYSNYTLNNGSTHNKTSTQATTEEFKDCPAANEFYKTIFDKPNEAELKNVNDKNNLSKAEVNEISRGRMLSIIKAPILKNLEIQALINNACGATSLGFLDGLYSELHENNKAKYYQEKLVAFADNNNPTAIESLCLRVPFDEPQMSKYCDIIIRDETSRFSKVTKESATLYLTSQYYGNNDAYSLSKICQATKDASCYNDLGSLADNLVKKNELVLAENYYNQIINYAESIIDLPNKNDYQQNTISSLSSLYRKTNQAKKLIKFCTNKYIHPSINEENKISCSLDLITLGDDLNEKYNLHKEAFELYMAATELDKAKKDIFNAYAIEKIAAMYKEGTGTTKNLNDALHWYYIALNAINDRKIKAEIYGTIGIIFNEKNDSVAGYNNFKKSAELGDSWYQVNLALMYFKGQGVIQDYSEAYAWANVALAIGIKNEKHKNLAEAIKKDAKTALIYNSQPGASLKSANELSKQHYNDTATNIDDMNS